MNAWNVMRFFTESYEKIDCGESAMKVPYLSTHPQAKQKVRIVRNARHNCVPNLTGKALPRADDEDARDIYCATMLALFKPWRRPEELRYEGESWEDAFSTFTFSAPRSSMRIMEHIQYSYRSKDAADAEREADPAQDDSEAPDVEYPQIDDDAADDTTVAAGTEPTENEIALAKQEQICEQSRLYAFEAIAAGHYRGVFNPEQVPLLKAPAMRAEGDDLIKLAQWRTTIEDQLKEQLAESTGRTREREADVVRLDGSTGLAQGSSALGGPERAIEPAKPEDLKPDQRRAHDIITTHLEKKIRGENPLQLLMHIQGEGGTGKSKVIQTVTEFFAQCGTIHMLQKMAYTGIAASLIEGKTTHSAASISKQVLRGMSDAKKAKMEAEWRNVEYIIIDEVSMIDREFFAVMSKNISIAKKSQTPDSIHAPFGGISVILCGDLHQFPPVIKGVPGALFQPNVATPAVTKPKKNRKQSHCSRRLKPR